jgi:mannose/cellobiose epimerase-like protein (N-acyl-D-glucosamine 2-epimerase family)
LVTPEHRAWLNRQAAGLLDFAGAAQAAPGGFWWLDRAGRPDLGHQRELWINCRMTHVFALGHLLGHPGARDQAEHGLAALRDLFADPIHGGWFAAVDSDGRPSSGAKQAYPLAFVILASASALQAGCDGAGELFEEATRISQTHFWDDQAGLVVEEWDASFSRLDPYRGANANMHTVEAYLAAADVSGQPTWRGRALRIADYLINGQARAADWRLPEHYDSAWRPLPDYNADRPADPFRPWGATVGHGLEWSRLLLQLRASLGPEAPDWLEPAALALFDRAVADGWSADGEPGFVYTVDWSGRPVVRQRMHWVVAEAIAAAATAYQVTGRTAYAESYRTWWDYAQRYLIDAELGSWRHELDDQNRPAATVWPGKPDVYHAFQTCLIPQSAVGPGLAAALAQS